MGVLKRGLCYYNYFIKYYEVASTTLALSSYLSIRLLLDICIFYRKWDSRFQCEGFEWNTSFCIDVTLSLASPKELSATKDELNLDHWDDDSVILRFVSLLLVGPPSSRKANEAVHHPGKTPVLLSQNVRANAKRQVTSKAPKDPPLTKPLVTLILDTPIETYHALRPDIFLLKRGQRIQHTQ